MIRLFLYWFAQDRINFFLKGLDSALAHGVPIDKEGWGAGNASLLGIHNVLIKFLPDFGGGHIAFELVHLQAKLDGNAVNRFIIDGGCRKEGIMKFPELALLTGSQSGPGGGIGELMHCQGHIFQDNLDGTRIFFEHLLEKRRNFAAVRSLKVREDGDGDWRIGLTTKGGARRIDVSDKINGQVGKRLRLAIDEVELFTARGDINGRNPFIHWD